MLEWAIVVGLFIACIIVISNKLNTQVNCKIKSDKEKLICGDQCCCECDIYDKCQRKCKLNHWECGESEYIKSYEGRSNEDI